MKKHRINPFALLLLTPALLIACAAEEPVVETEHPSVVVTQWNDSTELFLEYPQPVVNEALGNWAIHLSSMKDFKPVTSGTLTVTFLRGGSAAQSFTLEAPARDGIFLLDPVIENPGDYQVQLSLSSPQVTSTHEVPVTVWTSAEEIPVEEEAESTAAISFLKEQQWKIDWAIEPAVEQPVARSVAAPAEIVPRDGALVQVSAPTSGIALAASNEGSPSAGQAVSSGQVLAVLAPTAGEGGYARARGELERLQRDVARDERLFAAGAIPERRLLDARQQLEIAQAEIAAMGGGADADFRLRVRAPISGVIAERSFVPGGRVEAGQPLFTVVNPSAVWLKIQMPAGSASSLTRESQAIFTVEGTSRTFTSGRLISVGSVVDPQTRTVSVTYEVDNAGGLIQVGQFARASVPIGGTVTGVAIPTDAILDDNGTPVAFVQVGGESFERRVLTLGENDGLRTAILDGIRPGEMVVTRGGYQVRLASLSPEGFSGGHAH